jgi:tetratricopeptide (TPR) repeat protein
VGVLPLFELSKSDVEWFNKGNSLAKLGRLAEAINCYDRALEINPQQAKTWRNKGAILPKLGRFAEAINCYDRVLEINPQDELTWLGKGVAEAQLGLRRDAAVSYRKFIELAPASKHAQMIELVRKWLRELEGS